MSTPFQSFTRIRSSSGWSRQVLPSSNDIIFFQGEKSLKWDKILKRIRDDPTAFVEEEGGWAAFADDDQAMEEENELENQMDSSFSSGEVEGEEETDWEGEEELEDDVEEDSEGKFSVTQTSERKRMKILMKMMVSLRNL